MPVSPEISYVRPREQIEVDNIQIQHPDHGRLWKQQRFSCVVLNYCYYYGSPEKNYASH